MLQIIYRTTYWGCHLHGTRMRTEWSKLYPPSLRCTPRFKCEMSTSSFPFHGCCKFLSPEGTRTSYFDESHFLDTNEDNWDLFHYCTSHNITKRCITHTFALVPHFEKDALRDFHTLVQEQNMVDPNEDKENGLNQWYYDNYHHHWRFLGTCRASILRMDMENYISTFFTKNAENNVVYQSCSWTKYTDRKKHWHLDIFMREAMNRKKATSSHMKLTRRRSRRNAHYQSIRHRRAGEI